MKIKSNFLTCHLTHLFTVWITFSFSSSTLAYCDSELPHPYLPNASATTSANSKDKTPLPRNTFAQRLLNTLEFIDFPDFILAISQSNKTPWALYDSPNQKPMYDRWEEVKKKFQNIQGNVNQLKEIHHVIANDPKSDYRGHPVIGGGDIFVNGKGYYMVNEHQKEVLEKNPLLVLEVISRPSNNPLNKDFLVRHHYPSAATFEKISSFLPEELVKRLQDAKAKNLLKNTSTQEFQSLTQEVIKNLLEYAGTHIKDPIELYQFMMSTHPFGDFNGRSLRAFFQAHSGVPLFLKNWDMDLFYSPEELKQAHEIGQQEFNWIKKGLLEEEEANPRFPKFYDRPEFFEIAAEKSPEKILDLKKFVQLGKSEVIKNKENIRHKFFRLFFTSFQNTCSGLYQTFTNKSP